MNSPQSKQPTSNYDAPDTPIASIKRPVKNSKTSSLTSPNATSSNTNTVQSQSNYSSPTSPTTSLSNTSLSNKNPSKTPSKTPNSPNDTTMSSPPPAKSSTATPSPNTTTPTSSSSQSTSTATFTADVNSPMHGATQTRKLAQQGHRNPSQQLSNGVNASNSNNNNNSAGNTDMTSNNSSNNNMSDDLVFTGNERQPNESQAAWLEREKEGALFSPVLTKFGVGVAEKDKEESSSSSNGRRLDGEMDGEEGEGDANANTDAASGSKGDDVKMAYGVETDTNNDNDNNTNNDYTTEDNTNTNDNEYYEDEDDNESDTTEEFNPYLFIKQLPSYDSVKIHGKICLPKKHPSSMPISLVLDLDETLVHCTVEPIPDPDMIFPVSFGGVEYLVHVRKRPHLEAFLKAVCEKFEVIVFTASQKVYADELLDRIDPTGKYIKHRMFRESCLQVEGNYLKDLNVLGRDLKQSVLVDNSPHAFGYQVDNGIPIESWFDDVNDTELIKLEAFLRTLHGKSDVRPIVREKFKTHKLISDS